MEKILRYHNIEPGTKEYALAVELFQKATEFNDKYNRIMATMQLDMDQLNKEYQPALAALRKSIYPAFSTQDPDEAEAKGTLGVSTQFYEDTGIFIVVEQADLLPPNLAALMDFSPSPGGLKN